MNKFLLLLFFALATIAQAHESKTPEAITPTKIDEQLTFISGSGGNSVILEGDNAVLLIDTKMAGGVNALYDYAKNIIKDKKLIIVNTHYHIDHISGNAKYEGARIIAGGYEKTDWTAANGEANLPTEFLKDSLLLKIGDEEVLITNIGRAHTRGDIFVYMKKRKLLVSGDVILNKVYPVLIKEMGADTRLYISKINDFIKHYEVKNVVPGHGNYGDVKIIYNFTEFLSSLPLGAKNRAMKEELRTKYADWYEVPGYSSFDKNIEFVASELDTE